MEANLSMVIDQVGRDKNIDRAVLLQALEQAILTAAKRAFGMNREMEAKYNVETGSVDLFLIINVVEDDAIEGREITVEDAHKYGLEAELGDELLFQIFYRPEDAERASEQDTKFGDIIDLKAAHKKFGRIAAQTAKQVIVQKVREAERDRQYDEFKDRIGEIVNGVVKRVEYGSVIVDLGRGEAIVRRDEMLPREVFRNGDRVRSYIFDVRRETRGPQIFLSRTHPQFMAKLFYQEVPEIYDGIVEIKAVARDPTKRYQTCDELMAALMGALYLGLRGMPADQMSQAIGVLGSGRPVLSRICC